MTTSTEVAGTTPGGAELAGPTRQTDRHHTLDVIRGIALFGILLMNITAFGLPGNAYGDPTVYGGSEGADLWAWITTNMLFEGTQRGMFSILFGAGVILLLSRHEAAGRTDSADIYYRRNIWLIVFGLVHSYLILWLGEILFYYGVGALLLYPARNLRPRILLAAAVVALLANAAWNWGEGHVRLQKLAKYELAQAAVLRGDSLTKEQAGDTTAWNAVVSEFKSDPEKLAEQVSTYRGSYLDIFTKQAPQNARWESWGIYRWVFDWLSMMLIGMAFFKLGVLTLRQPTRLYVAMVVVGYTVGLVTNYLETTAIIADNFSVAAYSRTGTTYDVGRLGMTLGHLGLLLLFCRSGWLPWLQRSLAAVGQLALSNYVSQSIICAIVFYGFGFGLYGSLGRAQLYIVVFSIWVFQLIVSPIWLRHFRFGPLEWGWRYLTYLAPPAMRRVPRVVAPPGGQVPVTG